MSEKEWEMILEVAGSFQAEILRGLLEAQEIPVVLSQEGAGHSVYGLTVGELGRVQIFVPSEHRDRALQLLADAEAGSFESAGDEFQSGESPDGDQPEE